MNKNKVECNFYACYFDFAFLLICFFHLPAEDGKTNLFFQHLVYTDKKNEILTHTQFFFFFF